VGKFGIEKIKISLPKTFPVKIFKLETSKIDIYETPFLAICCTNFK